MSKSNNSNPSQLCLLISSGNHIEQDIITNILKNNNIPFYINQAEAGGYLNVYCGSSVFGADIYVNQSDFEIASNLIQNFKSNKYQGNDEKLEEKDFKSHYHKKNIMRGLILFFIFLPLLVGLVMLLFYNEDLPSLHI